MVFNSKINLSLSVPGYQPVPVNVDCNPHSGPAAFALGVRKSGSSLFANLVSAIAMAANRNVVDIPAAAFQNNIPYRLWCRPGPLKHLVWKSNVYVGFRDAPIGLYKDPVFVEAKKIILVRDPRDVLVSEFFSNAYSHSLPDENPDDSVVARERDAALSKGLETYVFDRVNAINETIGGYRPILNSGSLTIMRYEDVIFDKPNWIRSIASIFDMTVSDQLVENIMGWADIVPEKENSKKFVRRVTPGDHLEKLSPDVIEALDEKLSEVWWDLGYTRYSAR